MKKQKKGKWVYRLLSLVILGSLWAVFRQYGTQLLGTEVLADEREQTEVSDVLPQDIAQWCVSPREQGFVLEEVPAYAGTPYHPVNDNIPFFTTRECPETAFEVYSDLDALGRCGVTVANIDRDMMPAEERGLIGEVKPTGWQYAKYDFVDGRYLYNRCHLIGYQLTGENANERNLITGTRYMNVEGMLPFENLVAAYIRRTDGRVLYRVTPCFADDNLLAEGVLMEAWSVEDAGESVCFNVFCYNVQPGVEIDYVTGESRLAP